MSKFKITQVKSGIDRPHSQKNTLLALGLKGIGQSVEKVDNECVRGMIKKVAHLLSVETV